MKRSSAFHKFKTQRFSFNRFLCFSDSPDGSRSVPKHSQILKLEFRDHDSWNERSVRSKIHPRSTKRHESLQSRKSSLIKILFHDFYNFQPILEEYVLQQVREGEYDLDANMALLKLYQFYPNSIRHEVQYFFYLSKKTGSDSETGFWAQDKKPVPIMWTGQVAVACSLIKRFKLYFQIVLYVLLKGMMVLPEPDFVMYKALLSNLNDDDMDQSVRRSLGNF